MFTKQINAVLLSALLGVISEQRRTKLQNVVNASGEVQAAAAAFDQLIENQDPEPKSVKVVEGLVKFGRLYVGGRDLDDAAIQEAVDIVGEIVELEDDAQESAAENIFRTVVVALDAINELVADENADAPIEA